jgi:hypothetical protein
LSGAFGAGVPVVGYVEPGAAPGFHPVALRAVDLVGAPVADGSGGLIFNAPGGTYRWDGASGTTARVGDGTMLDVRGGHLLVVECSASLACQWRVVDLGSGASWTASAGADTVRVDVAGSVSPDGRRFYVRSGGNEAPTITVYDDAGGAVTIGLDGGRAEDLRWSDDGRWLVGLRGQAGVMAWRPGLAAPLAGSWPVLVGRAVVPVNGLLGVEVAGQGAGNPAPSAAAG